MFGFGFRIDPCLAWSDTGSLGETLQCAETAETACRACRLTPVGTVGACRGLSGPCRAQLSGCRTGAQVEPHHIYT